MRFRRELMPFAAQKALASRLWVVSQFERLWTRWASFRYSRFSGVGPRYTLSGVRILTLLAVLPWLLLTSCGSSLDVNSFYPTISDADKDGATTRGWIPDDIIPKSSRNIRVAGELSPSKEWCAFEFPVVDSEIFRSNLKTVDVLPSSVMRVPNPGVSWWPEVLRGNLDVKRINEAGFQLYAVERPVNSVNIGIYLFALDWPKGRGFFYWTYKS
jgi:hypothetical protein